MDIEGKDMGLESQIVDRVAKGEHPAIGRIDSEERLAEVSRYRIVALQLTAEFDKQAKGLRAKFERLLGGGKEAVAEIKATIIQHETALACREYFKKEVSLCDAAIEEYEKEEPANAA